VPVETHDEDVVALVAGRTTPANKFSKVEKVIRESGRVPTQQDITVLCTWDAYQDNQKSMDPNNAGSV